MHSTFKTVAQRWTRQSIGIRFRATSHHAQLCTSSRWSVSNPLLQDQHWKGIVVGEIKSISKHPNADNLNVCQVTIGENEPDVQIICGAGNVALGLKVPVATLGAHVLVRRTDDDDDEAPEPKLKVIRRHKKKKLKKSKLRGQVSQGMICSEEELGLVSTSSGILALASHVPVGTLLSTVLSPNTRT